MKSLIWGINFNNFVLQLKRKGRCFMEKWARKTVELAAGIFLTGEYNPSVIPYAPNVFVIASFI